MKPSWAEVSKYGTEVKYYWNRIDSLEIKENIVCRKWETEDGQTITWQIVVRDSSASNGFYGFSVAVGRQSAIYTENS